MRGDPIAQRGQRVLERLPPRREGHVAAPEGARAWYGIADETRLRSTRTSGRVSFTERVQHVTECLGEMISLPPTSRFRSQLLAG